MADERNRTQLLAEIPTDRAGIGLPTLSKAYGAAGGKPPPPHRRNIQTQEVLLTILFWNERGRLWEQKNCVAS